MPHSPVIGIVSPGAMGAALGRAWIAAGTRVVATVAGRSERTRRLAHGLDLLDSLADVVARAEIVVSVVPPHQAVETARAIAAAATAREVTPVVADLNAISPVTLEAVAAEVESAGCRLLDGAISGAPPRPGGDSVLFLAGPDAALLAGLDSPGLCPVVVGETPGGASAVKMSTAAVYKGFTALLLQSLQTAHANGVVAPVVDDLRVEFGPLIDDVAVRIAVAGAKSDRFPGEMHEIALTQERAGAGRELYAAMATVYERVARTPLGVRTPEEAARCRHLAAVLDDLAADG
ncbi:MAG: NAD(P)-binding domain-containing protein [Tetrasphaera sp.]